MKVFLVFNRTLGKASCGSECRLYSAIPKFNSLDNSLESSGSSNEKSRNERASYICGQDIHGDAILASVGYRWKSDNLEHDDVTVRSFYRSLYFSQFLLCIMFCFPFYIFYFKIIIFGNNGLLTSMNSEVMPLMFVLSFQ